MGAKAGLKKRTLLLFRFIFLIQKKHYGSDFHSVFFVFKISIPIGNYLTVKNKYQECNILNILHMNIDQFNFYVINSTKFLNI
jgi:hypothetical protein